MKNYASIPLWAQLRIAHGFAEPEEMAGLHALKAKNRVAAECAPSGCQNSGSETGGCKTGTSCLLSGLQ